MISDKEVVPVFFSPVPIKAVALLPTSQPFSAVSRVPLGPWKRHPQHQPSHNGQRPRLLFSPHHVCFCRNRATPLCVEFVDVGIMRPQPVNNETKDVAHQLRSTHCLASIASAPPTTPTPDSTPPTPLLCVFSFLGCVLAALSLLSCCCFLFVVVSSAKNIHKNVNHKSLAI